MSEFDRLFSACGCAFKQLRSQERARQLAYGILNCHGRPTITGMLSATGNQFSDWTQAYRLFNTGRIDVRKLFGCVLDQLLQGPLEGSGPIYCNMDDTLVKKSGKRVAGTGWKRDPLGPPFCNNFIWGQRFLQLSLSAPLGPGPGPAKAVPIDFTHCPSPRKPRKNAPIEQHKAYEAEKKKSKISQRGVEQIAALRKQLDSLGAADRQLVLGVDGGYTNGTVLKQLPERVTLIGRTRKDAVLHKLPEPKTGGRGRKRVYGERWPTPEEIRQSEDHQWQQVRAFAAGKEHTFDVKVAKGVRWKKAGEQDMQLVVVRPLAYRLKKGSKMLYRKPAYLLCTDPDMPVAQLLQAYIWRWEIEVNFREQKTVIGCGKPQVRTKRAVESVHAFMVAVYAMILTADHNIRRKKKEERLPRPKWYQKQTKRRQTTGDLLNLFKAQVWAKAAGINFTHFANTHKVAQRRGNTLNPAIAAVCYARK